MKRKRESAAEASKPVEEREGFISLNKTKRCTTSTALTGTMARVQHFCVCKALKNAGETPRQRVEGGEIRKERRPSPRQAGRQPPARKALPGRQDPGRPPAHFLQFEWMVKFGVKLTVLGQPDAVTPYPFLESKRLHWHTMVTARVTTSPITREISRVDSV